MDSAAIKAKARELGFDRCGIAPAAAHPELTFLPEWIGRGYAGSMSYLARSAKRRADVRQVVPSARTVIVTATNYNTDRPYSIECGDPSRAFVSRYAWGDDYHAVIGRRLEALLEWMRTTEAQPFDARAYVDTGPVQERVYAQHGGIGWIGKNTCVINPEIGSWIFLAEIICSLDLAVDAPATDQCGTCTLCLEACPTQAFDAPYVLDATKCISYLTIEQRGPIPDPLQPLVGGHVYGCDVCQEVCPWNQTAPASTDPAWQPRPMWDRPTIEALESLDADGLAAAIEHSAMERARTAGLERNIAVAARNRRQTRL
ncbi:MAG TPA: tRNA epoxyqueuosine(34) reductase QueG [Vicinamibacterales bacterium]|nr:tRNA epoxyqueuosine(34) reductase QueG [Vicinamibacterales bacterium]